jgi:HEAT repeat protein
MLQLVYKALNVRKEEESQVALMLGHGFFMGVFFATYHATAETVFLNTLGGTYINQGIFAAGFLGVITTGLFATLQRRISYAKLTILNLCVIFLLACLIYYLLKTTPKGTVDYDYVAFGTYALSGPITAVFLLGFWGVFGRMFDLRQSKRIIGGIDTGQLTAAIIAFFVMGFVDIPVFEDYLVVSAISIVFSLVFLILILKRYDIDVVKAYEYRQTSTNISALLKNKYVVLLSVFLALSVTAFLFVERSYLTVLDGQYSDSPQQLLRFIAFFSGTILILSFIFQTFWNDKIIANYGLRISLLILPVVLSIFVIATIIVGNIIGFDASQEGFIWFFLFVALSKLFISFLRDAMENPAFKLYFMPLENKVRFDIQTKVEGVVNEFAKALAGGLILALGAFALFNTLNYYYILVLVIGAWLFVTGKLYNEYRNKIKSNIAKLVFRDFESDLNTNTPEKAIFSFKIIEKLNPGLVSSGINLMMRNPNESIRDFAQRRMNEIRGVSVSDQYVISVKSEDDAKGRKILRGEDLESLLSARDFTKGRIAKLCRSEHSEDRIYSAELIGNSDNADTLSYLIELLRDIHPTVRLAAIKSSEKRYNGEILNGIISNLNDPRFGNLAMNSLVVIGQDALDSLDTNFYRTGQNFQVMRKVIQVMGRIGGARAKQLLWNKIDYPDKVLASQVLVSLGECGFRADFSQITRIKYAIESDIEDIAWNLAAYHEVPNTMDGQILKKSLQEENRHDVQHIYTLLSMLYETRSIQLVRENINSGTNEGVTYAIELLDVFLSEDLKQKVIPIVDDEPDDEKIKKLQMFYPRGTLGSKEVIKLLINREFNQTNRWSKSCALHMIGTMGIIEHIYDLIANLFNPDVLVREIAGWSLYQLDKEEYEVNTQRLNERVKRQLDKVIIPSRSTGVIQRSLRFDQVLYLKEMEMFQDVPFLVLSDLADIIEEIFIDKESSFSLAGLENNNFYVLFKGQLDHYRKGNIIQAYKAGDFIGEFFEEEEQDEFNSNALVSEENAIIWKMNKDRFFSLLSDNIDVARKVVDHLKVA